MDVLEEIETRLQEYPQAKYNVTNRSVRVAPTCENGFTVDLIANHNQYTVHFNGWHETFTDAEEALHCFAFGLSTGCRLKEYRRLGFAYKWTVEYEQEGRWIEDSTTGLFFFPFWGKATVRLLQNDLLNKT